MSAKPDIFSDQIVDNSPEYRLAVYEAAIRYNLPIQTKYLYRDFAISCRTISWYDFTDPKEQSIWDWQEYHFRVNPSARAQYEQAIKSISANCDLINKVCDKIISSLEKETETDRLSQIIAPGHNPNSLTVAQVGKGYRLLDKDEIKGIYRSYLQIERFSNAHRTNLSREALAALDTRKTVPVAWNGLPDVFWIRSRLSSDDNNSTLVTSACALYIWSADCVNWKPFIWTV